MSSVKYNKQELIVYTLLWGLLFIAPVVGHYVSTIQDDGVAFRWTDMFFLWRQYALFLIVFLFHNFFLAPLLLERQRRWLYFSLMAVLLAAFIAVQCSGRPDVPKSKPEISMENSHPVDMPPPPDRQGHPNDMQAPPNDMHVPPDDMQASGAPRMEPRRDMKRPPLVIGQHDVVAVIILILMLGMNLGVKLYFRQRADRQHLMLLEKQSLEQQLEYLRYQINPHFLMNTLNNIHALIDIDGERAKESIVSLSKIMRFVLYEGSRQLVPLSRELSFTQDYIELMRMRVTDRVKFSISMPAQVPDCQLPPLVLITFVENAFKHGVSYRQNSFIDIAVKVVDSQLRFSCRNSKIAKTDEQPGGVGLQNVRRRLDLIYGNRYSLIISNQAEVYGIDLVLPLSPVTTDASS